MIIRESIKRDIDYDHSRKSVIKSSANRHEKQIAHAIKEHEDKQLIQESYDRLQNDPSILAGKIAHNMHIRHEKRNKLPEIQKNLAESADRVLNDVLALTFAHAVYDAVPIDEEQKVTPENTNYIYNKAIDVYNGNLCTVTASPYFKNVAKRATIYIDNSKEKASIEGATLPDGLADQIVSKLVSGDITSKYFSHLVRDKVVQAVQNEGLISRAKAEAKKNNQYFSEEKSLYHSLVEHSYRQYLNESLDHSMEKRDLQDLANAEALINYTIMEALNTSKLVKFDYKKIRDATKYIAVN